MAEFKMPSLGADMDSGTLVEWLVHEGDTVHRGDPMAVVDTDKSAIEVESFDDGVVESFLVEPGTRVAVGTPLAALAPLAGAPAEEAERRLPAPPGKPPSRKHAAPPAAKPPAEPAAVTAAKPRVPKPRVPVPVGAPPLRHHAAELGVDLTRVSGTGPHGEVTRADVDRAAAEARAGARPETALVRPETVPVRPAARGTQVSPYARRLAEELGVDLARVSGTGRNGAVRAEDVRRAVEASARPTSAPVEAREEAPAAGEVPESRERSARATIAALMSRAKREIPHYYVATTVDLSTATEWLRRTNRERPVSERLVPAALLLKSAALAARQHPELNGFWADGRFVPGDDVHLGVAVSVRGGALVAPAIHHTADLDLGEVMAALRDLVKRARAGRLRRAEMADPTLTVTDLGDQGVEEVIGIIYPPQVALIGVGRIVERPWAVDGMIGVRPTVRLTLSGDHRATDGATGARFLNTVEQLLLHPEEL
ncbi:MAG TPA: 2-oxo acid dehydrogenase subunit E2 [Nocardioidaceae bacterium]|nr:2-oxo acid dehydrogenase subunit E2 [Nocardioidaceae bacterium]